MLNLPKLSQTQAAYANILAQSQGGVEVKLQGVSYHLSFVTGSFQTYDAGFFVTFKADNRTGHVLLKSFFFEAYLKSYFPDLNLMDLNDEVKLVLLDLAFADVMSALKTSWGVEEIEVVEMVFHPDSKKVSTLFQANLAQFPFHICDQKDEKREALLLMADADANHFLEVLKSHQDISPVSEYDLAKLYVSICISLGSAKFTIAELYRVMVGDVILLHNFRAQEDGFLAQLWSEGQLLFLLNIKDQDIIVEKKMDLSMTDEDDDLFDFSDEDDEEFKKLQEMISQGADDKKISDDLPQESVVEPAVDDVQEAVEDSAPTTVTDVSQAVTTDELKQMQIKLNFVIDSQVMSFEELQKLSPGYHFNLNKAPTSPISILANGKDFATGELVQIEDKVGVKVTKINI